MAGLFATTAFGGSLFFVSLSGQNAASQNTPPTSPRPDAQTEFRDKVLPVVSNTCMECHNDAEFAGDLDFGRYLDPKAALAAPAVWAKVLDMLASGKMPPKTAAPLSPAETAGIMSWIERTYGLSAGHRDPATADPGRVTARRLNKLEYRNTVRDLLGVTTDEAEDFPVDDAGYGFDNIGDVLTMSPMLMEKYLRAARNISRAAVYGESYPAKPTLLVKLQPKKDQDDSPAVGDVLPFSIRGALYGTYRFPVDAEYEFRWRYGNTRGTETPAAPAAGASPNPAGRAGNPGANAGRGGAAGAGRGTVGRGAMTPADYAAREERERLGAPPVLMVFTIDGRKVYDYVVEGTINYNYTRGENHVRVRLPAGEHALRISWPDFANVADPVAQYGNDGRRKLFVDYLDIHGPFAPAKDAPAGLKKVVVCGAPGKYTAACVRQIVETLLSRAYRRPATADETRRLVALVNQVQRHDSFEEGIRVAIEAALLSPHFLFRVERDQAAAAAPRSGAGPASPGNPYRLSDYELASRLSYFLWSSMPDDELFRLAREKRLQDPAVLEAQVARMLKDARAAALVDNFGEQWLSLRVMDQKKPDAAKFRAVDDELLDGMRTETRMFLGEVFREDRSILDLIDGKFTYLNGPLARYYGIAGVDGEEFRRVELASEERGGIVTHGSVLSISSFATRTSPVLRGKWVLDNLLGSPPPPPPDNIPALVETDLGSAASMRQRLEQHRANPACAACHDSMDPIGFALENYDAAGRWRAKDGNFDIDSSGTLPDGRSLVGAKGLKDTLRTRAGAFAEHFIDRLMTFGLGRGLERSDRPVLQQITAQAASKDYRFSAVVLSIVTSRPFQMRSRSTP